MLTIEILSLKSDYRVTCSRIKLSDTTEMHESLEKDEEEHTSLARRFQLKIGPNLRSRNAGPMPPHTPPPKWTAQTTTNLIVLNSMKQ